MQISASPLQETRSPTSADSSTAGRGSFFALIALGTCALLPALLTAFNVLHNPAHTDAAIYGLASISYLAAALSQRVLLPSGTTTASRVRWNLWVGYLLLNAVGLFLSFLDDKDFIHIPADFKHVFISIAYAFAYIVTVNPPRSTAWRRLWLVDALIACVMGVTFFLVYHYGEPAGVYTSLIFAVAIRVILALGSVLALRTADSPAAHRLARFMTVYFILSALMSGLENFPHVWPRLSISPLGDLLYTLPAITIALMPLVLQGRLALNSQTPSLTRALPPAAPVLITCAILLACLPLLHFNVVTGLALLVLAIGLFAAKVALMQTDFEHERTSLLQSNKQLRELAYMDPVTGIPNRRKFLEVAENALQVARRGLEPHWLLLIELENLRSVFASRGRRASEQYLCEFVHLVTPVLDPSHSHFAHIANGEFAILLKRANQQSIESTVQRIHDALYASRINIATGAALATSSGPDSVERWLANAGTLLHRNRAFELHAQAPA